MGRGREVSPGHLKDPLLQSHGPQKHSPSPLLPPGPSDWRAYRRAGKGSRKLERSHLQTGGRPIQGTPCHGVLTLTGTLLWRLVNTVNVPGLGTSARDFLRGFMRSQKNF